MPKHDLCILVLHKFKLGHSVSETLFNINRAWRDGSTRDRIV